MRVHKRLNIVSFQTQPKTSFSQAEVDSLTDRIQNAGTEVVNAKAGAVSSLQFGMFRRIEMSLYVYMITTVKQCNLIGQFDTLMKLLLD